MEYYSRDLDHLGIVATMCDDIGIVKEIDKIVFNDVQAEMSLGEVAKLMIINGLGFASRPMYLEAQFFSSKPIARLLGREISSDIITDDRLGRALDRFYEFGCDHIFARVANKAAIKFGIDTRFKHLDTTSMSVHGEYSKDDNVGLVQYGHSKDNNPDLKQFMVSLMSSQDGDVPLLAQTIAGNISDKTHFREVLKGLKKEAEKVKDPCYYVADSALYTKKT